MRRRLNEREESFPASSIVDNQRVGRQLTACVTHATFILDVCHSAFIVFEAKRRGQTPFTARNVVICVESRAEPISEPDSRRQLSQKRANCNLLN